VHKSFKMEGRRKNQRQERQCFKTALDKINIIN
jgi:hypothetical protein